MFDQVVQALGAAGGMAGIVAVLGVLVQRNKINAEARKAGADAAAVLSDTAVDLLAPYKEQVTELRGEIGRLRMEVQALLGHLNKLEHMLSGAGIKPPVFQWPTAIRDSNGKTHQSTERHDSDD